MYQWRKDIATWQIGEVLYASIPFTWLLPQAKRIAEAHDGPIVLGGPAVDLMPEYVENIDNRIFAEPYVTPLTMHNPMATRTSIGCPNRCPFCINQHRELRELPPDWTPRPTVIDDAFLSTSDRHQNYATERLAHLPLVDFNQGLSAALFRGDAITRLQRLRLRLRFAWDDVRNESPVIDAITRAKTAGLRDIRCYVLVGFNDTPADARYRCETLHKLGVMPNPMRFQPLDVLVKDSYVGPGWTNPELRRFCRYWARHRWTAGVPYDEFDDERLARAEARVAREREKLQFDFAAERAAKGGCDG